MVLEWLAAGEEPGEKTKPEEMAQWTEIRNTFLGQLGQFGKESHEGFFISWPLHQLLPKGLKSLVQPYPGRTAVNLKGNWQGSEIAIEISAPAPKSQIQIEGKIDYPVFVEVKMGERSAFYCLNPQPEKSNSSRKNKGDLVFYSDKEGVQSCLELDKITELIKASGMRLVENS